MLPAAARRIEVHHAGRVGAAPVAVVARQRPQPPGLGPAPAGVENRGPGLVHEQLAGLPEAFGQPVDHRPEVERGLADPPRQRRAVKIEPGAGVDLRLAMQRTVVGVLRDEHMGDRALARKRALDEVRRRRGLGDALLAAPAGVLRPHGDDDPKLRRHDVEPLGAVLADAHHLAAAARAVRAVGLDHLLDAGQVLGKMAEVALGRGAFGTRRPLGARRRRFFGLGQRPFELLQGEPELVGMKLLGLLPEHRPAQLAQQVFETAVLLFQMAVETFEGDRCALADRRCGLRGGGCAR